MTKINWDSWIQHAQREYEEKFFGACPRCGYIPDENDEDDDTGECRACYEHDEREIAMAEMRREERILDGEDTF